ncbi:MAG: hypothetical protein ACYC5O_15425 [Anaerolineae bacterium]
MRLELSLLPLIALPAVVAGLAFFLRGWSRAPQMVVVVSSTIVAYFTHASAAGLTGDLVGRTLVFDAPAKLAFMVALITVALVNLVLTVYPVNNLLPPASSLCASLVGLAVCLDNLTLAPLALLIAAAAAVAGWNVRESTRGHLQYLVAATAGALLLALAGTILDEVPDAQSRTALIAFELGAGLLLALIPFGFWEVSLARDTDPLSVTLANLALKPAALVLVWRFTSHHQWLAATGSFSTLLRVAALATIVYGAVRAAVAPSPRVFAAAAAQGHFGLVVLTLLPALGSSSLLPVTGLALLARVPVVIFLSTVALGAPVRLGRDSRILLAIAIAAVLGLPGTPLFAAHFSGLLSLSSWIDLFPAFAILGVGLAIGGARSTSYGEAGADARTWLSSEALIACLAILAVLVAVGLRPAYLYALLGQ